MKKNIRSEGEDRFIDLVLSIMAMGPNSRIERNLFLAGEEYCCKLWSNTGGQIGISINIAGKNKTKPKPKTTEKEG